MNAPRNHRTSVRAKAVSLTMPRLDALWVVVELFRQTRMTVRLAILMLLSAAFAWGGDVDLPEPIDPGQFDQLLNDSPFTRRLNSAGSVVITGFFSVEGRVTLCVKDNERGKTHLVSEDPNALGWRLVAADLADNPAQAAARIAVEGGEVMEIRYDQLALKPGSAQKGGTNLLPDWVNQIDDPVEKGIAIQSLIEKGAFDAVPFKAVDMALNLSDPQARAPAISAAFARAVGSDNTTAVNRLNALPEGRDRDFAINGLAHGLVGSDPRAALNWAQSISQESFRNVVIGNINRRIAAQSSKVGNGD